VVGVYVCYQDLFREYVRENGSIFYSDDWLASAKSVATNKVVIVPVGLVLDTWAIDPNSFQDLIGWGVKPIGSIPDSQYCFPVVACRY